MFFKIFVSLKNCANLLEKNEKNLCWSLFLITLEAFRLQTSAKIVNVNPKTAGGGVSLTPPTPYGFSKTVSSKERVKPWFFVAFNIIISHIFPENFIVKFLKSFRRYEEFFCQY